MEDFSYHNPTRIVFGKSSLKKLAGEIGRLGARRVMVVYGGGFLEQDGTLGKVMDAVRSAGAHPFACGDVLPNPTVSAAGAIAKLAQSEDADALLAVGGGSVIDTAKAVAVVLANGGSLDDLLLGRTEVTGALPVGVVLTLAGSGSESSCSVVLTMDEGRLKRSFDSDLVRPRFAVLDPTLTYSLPRYQMLSGACDILMHTMERYFSPSEGTELIDRMAEGLMRAVIDSTRAAAEDPRDYGARANLMWAGSLSHGGLLGTGRVEDWACHRLEHELSGLFDVVHGAGLCALWGSWARYVQPACPSRFAEFGRRVMGVAQGADDQTAGVEGIARFVSFFAELGMPTSLSDLAQVSLSDPVIERMTNNCLLTQDTIGGLMPLGHDDIVAIYRKAGGLDA